jgi:hypothetical protein
MLLFVTIHLPHEKLNKCMKKTLEYIKIFTINKTYFPSKYLKTQFKDRFFIVFIQKTTLAVSRTKTHDSLSYRHDTFPIILTQLTITQILSRKV